MAGIGAAAQEAAMTTESLAMLLPGMILWNELIMGPMEQR